MIANPNQPPSIWIGTHQPEPHPTASYVEYLRWMRSPNANFKDATKVELLQTATDIRDLNYRNHLDRLIQRTKLIAGNGNWFEVACPWRIRVGGRKGPESMLLPAFDALGMPHIPSSTLRGIARAAGLKELMTKSIKPGREQGLSHEQARERARQDAERIINQYFGDLNAPPEDQCGKIIFLDAYPIANDKQPNGGVSVDMVNPIWQWEGDRPSYGPNPNAFLSLERSTFIVGMKPRKPEYNDILPLVRRWLIHGFQNGIGSRVNSGYGELQLTQNSRSILSDGDRRLMLKKFILRLPFELEGQLIHGRQRITWNYNDRGNTPSWQARNTALPEVRPVAFRSMLRYWFRVFAMATLSSSQVQQIEEYLFGGISTSSPSTGRFRLEISRTNRDQEIVQEGVLGITHGFTTKGDRGRNLKRDNRLLKSLTWLMFHLGGIGQGARRPKYERNGNPPVRGSDLIVPSSRLDQILPKSDVQLWTLPSDLELFKERFHEQLKIFYDELCKFSGAPVQYQKPLSLTPINAENWVEALDGHCVVLAVQKLSKEIPHKPFALDLLHEIFHDNYDPYNAERRNLRDLPKVERERLCSLYTEAKNLCGGVEKEQIKGGFPVNRDVVPSPIWIKDLRRYQIVTVFGATKEPRSDYLDGLTESVDKYVQLWPISQN